ncbi:MAG: T9SS type A sorting domain-containing protein [Rhodothermales bacterium]
MRYAPLLFALVLAPAALAQPCDPAQTDDACPDTTDWHRYFPLEVGNIWQYEDGRMTGEPVTFSSWAIVGQTEVAGQAYFEFEQCDEAADGSAVCADPLLLRYDEEHELIVRRTDDGDAWWDVLPCRLGTPFNTGGGLGEPNECTGPASGFTPVLVEGAYGAVVDVPPDEVAGDTRKSFEMYPGTGPEMYAGLGVTQYFYDLVGEPMRLVYAHVGGEQVGTPAFASCDPSEAGTVVCPDTTDWRRYLPLEVGNAWQYRVRPPVQSNYEHGTEIVGETEIDGEPYFLARRCTKPLFDDLTCTSPFPIRYDEASRKVVRRGVNTNSGEVVFSPFQVSDYEVLPCPLDAPFGESVQECTFFAGVPYLVSGVYGAGYGGIGDTQKEFDDLLQGVITLVAGLGPVSANNIDTDTWEDILYARIGGEEVGTPAFVFPTAGEPIAAQPTATAFTTVFPNPARGPVQAQYALGAAQAVTLELIDLLGRRVRSEEVGRQAAGIHDVRLDMGGLRAGLYVLRLRGDAGAEATRRVVVL